MLRRAPTGLLHRQGLSQHLQNATHRRPISSTPLFLSERESRSRLGYSRNSSSSSSSIPKVEDDAVAGGEGKNSTTHALSDTSDTPRASINDATPVTRGRTRSLRPILVPPSFPSSELLPIMSVPETSSSSDQKTETGPSSSLTTAVTLTGLPPNTVRDDIRSVLERFGKVSRIFVQPQGMRADVVFADVHGVKRTLHAYAERPLLVRGREIIVFRKNTMDTVSGTDTGTSRTTRTENGRGGRAIFVSNFHPRVTQEELLRVLKPFGKYKRFVMGPGSKHAYFIFSNADRVKEILSVHQRAPISLEGRPLRIERAEGYPFTLSPVSLGDASELKKPLDPATSSILKELTQTVSRFRGLHDPSRVLWVGGMPTRLSWGEALRNFWSRLGCVVDVRTGLGYAYVEFTSTEEALRALRQGAPHGFCYRQHLLNIDFAPSEFYIGPVYRAVYISGWPASDGQPALVQWTDDVPNIVEATVLPPFRGEKPSDPRSAILRFKTIDDARAALRMLDGRVGPGGETLHVKLSRPTAVRPKRLWQWFREAEEAEKSGDREEGEARLEEAWGWFGFGTYGGR